MKCRNFCTLFLFTAEMKLLGSWTPAGCSAGSIPRSRLNNFVDMRHSSATIEVRENSLVSFTQGMIFERIFAKRHSCKIAGFSEPSLLLSLSLALSRRFRPHWNFDKFTVPAENPRARHAGARPPPPRRTSKPTTDIYVLQCSARGGCCVRDHTRQHQPASSSSSSTVSISHPTNRPTDRPTDRQAHTLLTRESHTDVITDQLTPKAFMLSAARLSLALWLEVPHRSLASVSSELSTGARPNRGRIFTSNEIQSQKKNTTNLFNSKPPKNHLPLTYLLLPKPWQKIKSPFLKTYINSFVGFYCVFLLRVHWNKILWSEQIKEFNFTILL